MAAGSNSLVRPGRNALAAPALNFSLIVLREFLFPLLALLLAFLPKPAFDPFAYVACPPGAKLSAHPAPNRAGRPYCALLYVPRSGSKALT